MSSTVSPNIQNLTSKSHVQIASRPVRFPLTPAINVTHPRNSTVLQPLIFLSSTPKVLLSALTWPAQHVTAYVESHPERRWLTQSVADDMMLKSYKGRRIPQPEFECAENEPRAVIIRRQVELRTCQARRFLAATASRQLWGQSPLSLEFNVNGFDRFEFKFRPKRSDFGRKKLRTAETAVGFRLSEVVLSPGRRGGKLGGLQQALRRTPVFYPYRADSQSGPSPLGVHLLHQAHCTRLKPELDPA